MLDETYTKDRTALLFIDPYNDFLSGGGKLWPMVQPIADEVELIDNLRIVTAAVRSSSCRTAAGSRATLKPGITRRPSSWRLARGKPSRKEAGAANGIPISRRRLATSSPRNTGARAGSPTPISIFCSSNARSFR